jgi:hypothetical protein
MSNPPPPPSQPPSGPAPQEKKGLPPLAWVGIGCGTVLVLGIVIFAIAVTTCVRKVKHTLEDFQKNPDKAAAEMVVRMNPDLEKVSQNDEAGTITVRMKDTGETITVSYGDLAEGRLKVTGKDGSTTVIGAGDMEKVPGWVPKLENADKASCLFQHESDGEISGVLHFETSQSMDEVKEFFESEANKAGFNTSSSSNTSFNGTENASMKFEGGARSLSIALTRSSSGKPLMVQVGYKEKK